MMNNVNFSSLKDTFICALDLTPATFLNFSENSERTAFLHTVLLHKNSQNRRKANTFQISWYQTIASIKSMKQTINEIAQEFICPLSLELPVDPITAEDGKVYEREMTEKLIETQGSSLKSPITNEPMGSRLLPAVSIRNAIDALMKTSMIDGDLAEKHEDRKLVFEVKKMAAKNKIDAMRTLASWHANGSHGLPKDLTESIALVDKTDVLELEHKAITGDSDACKIQTIDACSLKNSFDHPFLPTFSMMFYYLPSSSTSPLKALVSQCLASEVSLGSP